MRSLRTLDGRITGATGVVADCVSSDGSTFNCLRGGAGAYTIYFDPPFSRPPIVTASVHQAGNPYVIVISGPSIAKEGFVANTLNVSNVATDADWTFHATGY